MMMMAGVPVGTTGRLKSTVTLSGDPGLKSCNVIEPACGDTSAVKRKLYMLPQRMALAHSLSLYDSVVQMRFSPSCSQDQSVVSITSPL